MRVRRLDGGVVHDGWENLAIDETLVSVRHRIVFQTALAPLAVSSPVVDEDGEHDRNLLGGNQIVERVVHVGNEVITVLPDHARSGGPVDILARYINANVAHEVMLVGR